MIGYVERLGVDEKNRYEPRIYPPRFYQGINDAYLDRSALTQKPPHHGARRLQGQRDGRGRPARGSRAAAAR